jgi:hypothetical protein
MQVNYKSAILIIHRSLVVALPKDCRVADTKSLPELIAAVSPEEFLKYYSLNMNR